MKKNFFNVFLIFVMLGLLVFLTGCGRALPKDTPTALVILSGKHANSKTNELSLENKIKQVYSTFGNISIIVVDGNPQILRDENENIVGFYDEQYIKNSKNDYKYEMWENDYLIPQVSVVDTALKEVYAGAPEVDTLKALQMAATALNTMENSMGEVKKEIIICDTGLCTSGALNFLNTNNFQLVKSPVKLWENDDRKKEVEKIIDKLYETMEIPDLSGVTVTWYGLGNVCEPQPELDNLSIQNLQYIWGELLKRTNANPSKVGGTDSTYGVFVSVNANKPVHSDQSVTPVILWENTEGNKSKLDYPKFTEEKLGFISDSDEYRPESDTKRTLRPYANNLQKYPYLRILVVGTTSSSGGGSVSLSEKRAKRVKQTLVELNVPSEQIEIVGLGYSPDWCEDDRPNGIFNPKIAERNRAVFLLPYDSEKSQKIIEKTKK